MAPVVHGLKAEYSEQINFVFLNVNDPRTYEYRDKLGYIYQPEFYLLDADGTVLKKFIGYVPKESLETEFLKYIQ